MTDISKVFQYNQLEKYFRATETTFVTRFMELMAGNYALHFLDEQNQESKAGLVISEPGDVKLTVDYLVYTGTAMLCEGSVLSIYFTQWNGIPHCGQILCRIGKKAKPNQTGLEASWHYLDEDFKAQVRKVELSFLQ